MHRIPLPLPSDALRAVNVYAIESADGLVLIDSGWSLANSLEQLKRSLATLGAGLPDVRQFLCTHMHRDHYTQAIEVRRLLGTHVALGHGEKPSIDGLMSGGFTPFRAQQAIVRRAGAAELATQLAQLTSRAPSEAAAEELHVAGVAPDHPPLAPGTTFGAALGFGQPDQWIAGGEEFDLGTRRLVAIETPGHTRGHLVFADNDAGLLFAGDHVLPHITPSIGFQEAPADNPLQDYLQSLSLVRGLPDMRLLPAHGAVSDSTHIRIDELTDHHAGRLELMAGLVARGEQTGFEVATATPWTSRHRKLSELDVMNQMLAVCETVYHLDLLVARSILVSQTGEDGIRRYAPAPGD